MCKDLRKQDSATPQGFLAAQNIAGESRAALLAPQQLLYFNRSVQSFSGVIRLEFLLHYDDSAFLYLHFHYFFPC